MVNKYEDWSLTRLRELAYDRFQNVTMKEINSWSKSKLINKLRK